MAEFSFDPLANDIPNTFFPTCANKFFTVRTLIAALKAGHDPSKVPPDVMAKVNEYIKPKIDKHDRYIERTLLEGNPEKINNWLYLEHLENYMERKGYSTQEEVLAALKQRIPAEEKVA